MHLELSGLCLHYPGRARPAVNQLDLSLAQGEIGVLVGPSGCGKTSLLRAVAGLEPITAGQIRIHDRVVSSPDHQVAPETRRVGMVFQDFALFPHLSVARNVAYGLHGQSAQAQQARTALVLEWVGLTELADRYPHQLSGGQQQRVALARALAPEPDLLLLDEPFSSLDIELRQRLAHDLRALLKKAGVTALMVTHDQMEAFAMGDQVGVMQDGQLHQWSRPYDIYHQPATQFVADFIGHSVWLPATWHREHGGNAVSPGASVRRLFTPLGEWLAPLSGETASEGSCRVLFRADDIVHDDDSPIKARIINKQFRGADFLYVLELDGGEHILSLVPSHHDHQLGEPIGIRVMPDHLIVFND
jgi:iron(III) transport system ATP-binding protein